MQSVNNNFLFLYLTLLPPAHPGVPLAFRGYQLPLEQKNLDRDNDVISVNQDIATLDSCLDKIRHPFFH